MARNKVAMVPLFPGLAMLGRKRPEDLDLVLACDPGSLKVGFSLVRRKPGKAQDTAVAEAWQVNARDGDSLEDRIATICTKARPIMRAALDAGCRWLAIERSMPIDRGGKGTGSLETAWVMGHSLGAIAGTWALSGAHFRYVYVPAWRSALKGFLVPINRDYKAPAVQLCKTAFGLDLAEDAAQAVCLGYACLVKPALLLEPDGGKEP